MSFLKKDKETVIEAIVSAVSLIPYVGDKAAAAHGIIKSIYILYKEKTKADTVIDIIRNKVRRYNLSEEDARSICSVITGILKNQEIDLIDIYRDASKIQNLKNEIFRGSDHRKEAEREYKKYIEEVIDCIGKPEILALFVDSEQIAIENLHIIREMLLSYNNSMSQLNERVEALEAKDYLNGIESNNEDYLNQFEERLFLEDDYSSINLSSIYVSPRVKEGGRLASECIMSWYRNHEPNARSCMILYGDAGIGKSSLISKIISDAYNNSNKHEYSISSNEVVTVVLRESNHKKVFENIEKDFSAVDMLCKLFSVRNRSELKNKLLILDGFDELIVLVDSFDKSKASEFISALASERHGLRILITTRLGYFELDAETQRKTVQKTLSWTPGEVNVWCDQYQEQMKKELEHNDIIQSNNSEIQSENLRKIRERITWCDTFKTFYQKLPENDNRREIFCVPIILYIACISGVEFRKLLTVGKIYDFAFRSIIMRKYSESMIDCRQFKHNEVDIKERIVHWQYTKELAYQMLLVDDLNLIDDDSLDSPQAAGFRQAQERTIEILKDKNITIDKSELNTSKYLAVFHFASSKNQQGITFAHKTVYEFFTAVKLYEDYFSKFTTGYFKDSMKSSAARKQCIIEVMESWIEAFRYVIITPEIFMYLNEMERPAFSGIDSYVLPADRIDNNTKFNKQMYLDAFAEGLNQDILALVSMRPAVNQYLNTANSQFVIPYIHIQFNTAFHNLTWFLTGLGYKNENDLSGSIAYIMRTICVSNSFYSIRHSNIPGSKLAYNCTAWCFKECELDNIQLNWTSFKDSDLSYAVLNYSELNNANMKNANLKHTGLIGCKMNHADLKEANLYNADLSNAELRNSILKRACLKNADLNNSDLWFADLRGADLSYANLSGAILIGTDFGNADCIGVNWNNAKYCTIPKYKTEFPYGFDPNDYNMIEVDQNGNSV